MATFTEYFLQGTTPAWPIAAAQATLTGTPPQYTYTYPTTTSANYIGVIPNDINGAISVQVVTISGAAATLNLEVCNRDPTTQLAFAGVYSSGNISQDNFGLQALFTDVAADGLWVPIQVTNVNTNTAAVAITAAGLYVAQALGYRIARIRIISGTTPTAQVILGYGTTI